MKKSRLQRKKRLQSKKPLRPSSQLRRTGRLRSRSKKTEQIYRNERTPLNKRLLQDDGPQRCQFPLGCAEVATVLHEYHTRGQSGSYVDEANVRLSCVTHNNWAEDHPIEADRIGWRRLNK